MDEEDSKCEEEVSNGSNKGREVERGVARLEP
jgi:hypothetical protein